jgi:hypothetical protein
VTATAAQDAPTLGAPSVTWGPITQVERAHPELGPRQVLDRFPLPPGARWAVYAAAIVHEIPVNAPHFTWNTSPPPDARVGSILSPARHFPGSIEAALQMVPELAGQQIRLLVELPPDPDTQPAQRIAFLAPSTGVAGPGFQVYEAEGKTGPACWIVRGEYARRSAADFTLGEPGPEQQTARFSPRKSTRKVVLPREFADHQLIMPNIQNHATRHLGQIMAGAATWEHDPNSKAFQARINGQTVGMIAIGSEGVDEAARIGSVLSPRALQTMVAVTNLILQKTHGMPVNRGATIHVREIALATGHTSSGKRAIDPATLARIGADLRAMSRVMTWGADGPWNKQNHRYPSAWIAPLIVIAAVHVEQPSLHGDPVPYEFDAMLGRPWAAAVRDHFDVAQVAPGFLKLDASRDEQAIRLAWWYQTQFRYGMMYGPRSSFPSLKELTARAVLSPSTQGADKHETKNLRRLLDRLDGWHRKLAELEIIGSFRLLPAMPSDTPLRTLCEACWYGVAPPAAISGAYEPQRYKIRAADSGRKGESNAG